AAPWPPRPASPSWRRRRARSRPDSVRAFSESLEIQASRGCKPPARLDFEGARPDGRLLFSLIRVRLLPEILAADVEGGLGLDLAVAVDGALAGQAHLLLVADGGQHGQRVHGQVGALEGALGAEVLHALLDQDAAGAAQPEAGAVEVAVGEGVQ